MDCDRGESFDGPKDEEICSDFDVQGDILAVCDEGDESVAGVDGEVDVFPFEVFASVVF